MTSNPEIGRPEITNIGKTRPLAPNEEKEPSKIAGIYEKFKKIADCKAALADCKAKLGFELENLA